MKMKMRMIVAANESNHYRSMSGGICNSVAAHTFTHRMHALKRIHAHTSHTDFIALTGNGTDTSIARPKCK